MASVYHDPRYRALFYQAVLLAVVAWGGYSIFSNTTDNLARQGIASGFGFMSQPSGFGIVSHLIPYDEDSSYGSVFLVGLLNTLLLATLGIVLSTIMGLVIGVARLSRNWLVSRLAAVYVETFRNIPLLLQIFFWYFAVLRNLPGPRQSLIFGDILTLNNRGLYFPTPTIESGAGLVFTAFVVAAVVASLIWIWAGRRLRDTGQTFPALSFGLGLVVILPTFSIVAGGASISWDWPALRGFNYRGGAVMIPEFVAMLVALTAYTTAYIAEIIRAGIISVDRGQREAALSLGLRPGQTLRLVVLPLAMRVIIPPLTSQYLNLIKNSSLAAAIAYPELVAVFAGTVLNQTGQAVEVIALTMTVYLTISLIISLLMNWYNARLALVER